MTEQHARRDWEGTHPMTPTTAMEALQAALAKCCRYARVSPCKCPHCKAAVADLEAWVEEQVRELRDEIERMRERLFMSIPIAGNHPLRPGSGGASARTLAEGGGK